MDIWADLDRITTILEDLGIDTTSWVADSHAKMKSVVLEAQREFEGRTRRKFEEATRTEKHDGRKKNTLVLKYYPVSNIASIKILDVPIGQAPYILTGWRLEEETGIVIATSTLPVFGDPYGTSYLGYFPEGKRNIEVEYTYGYPSGDIPEDIVDAIELMTVLDIMSRSPQDWEKEGLVSIRIAAYSESYGAGSYYGGAYGQQRRDWTERIKMTIARHKKIPVR